MVRRKLGNMRVTGMPIVVEALGMIHKGLEMGLDESKIGRDDTALLESRRILRRVQMTG